MHSLTLTRHILMKALEFGSKRVDFVLDTYKSPCLKDITRDMRGDDLDVCDEVYSFGSGQKTPSNFLALLKYSNFKKEFLQFFFEEIRKSEYGNIFGEKLFYCSVDNDCIRIQRNNDGEVRVDDIHELHGDHDEADTRVAFHALHADENDPGDIVIRCNDTDVLIIMLTNVHKFQHRKVWLDIGLGHNNTRSFIDVKATAENLQPYVQALAGIYSFTGNDYIPSFYRKGKKRPIEIMVKSEEFISVFSKMGEVNLTDDDLQLLESFVCVLYGYGKMTSIDEARFLHFKNKCKPKEESKPLDSIKNVDPCSFPPCKKVLMEQIKRSWFVSRLYKYATEAAPLADYTLLDFGYILVDNRVQVKWFEGDQVPSDVEDDATLDESDDGDEEDEVTDEESSEDESSSENESSEEDGSESD